MLSLVIDPQEFEFDGAKTPGQRFANDIEEEGGRRPWIRRIYEFRSLLPLSTLPWGRVDAATNLADSIKKIIRDSSRNGYHTTHDQCQCRYTLRTSF